MRSPYPRPARTSTRRFRASRLFVTLSVSASRLVGRLPVKLIRLWLLLATIIVLAIPQAVAAQEPPTGFPFSFVFPLPPQSPAPSPEPSATPESAPPVVAPLPAEPVRPRNDPDLKPITLG